MTVHSYPPLSLQCIYFPSHNGMEYVGGATASLFHRRGNQDAECRSVNPSTMCSFQSEIGTQESILPISLPNTSSSAHHSLTEPVPSPLFVYSVVCLPLAFSPSSMELSEDLVHSTALFLLQHCILYCITLHIHSKTITRVKWINLLSRCLFPYQRK